MHYNTYFLVILYLIYWNKYKFISGRALVGHNVNSVQYNEYPYIVCIAGIEEEILEENIWCTGTLITFFHVLTSEHCIEDVENEPYRLIVGSNDLYRGSSFYPAWWISYDQWCNANNRTIRYRINDVGIIKLIGSVYPLVTLTVTLSSITDPTVLYGLQVIAVGWGTINDDKMPSYLQGANLTIVTNHHCEAEIEKLLGYRRVMDERYICSIACPYTHLGDGDSGGPLLYQGILLAINKATSPNINYFHPDLQNVHVYIEYYRIYINTLIEI